MAQRDGGNKSCFYIWFDWLRKELREIFKSTGSHPADGVDMNCVQTEPTSHFGTAWDVQLQAIVQVMGPGGESFSKI